jgi:hypothetical protein
MRRIACERPRNNIGRKHQSLSATASATTSNRESLTLPHALNQIVNCPTAQIVSIGENLEPCEPEFTRAHAPTREPALQRPTNNAHRAQFVHLEHMNGREKIGGHQRPATSELRGRLPEQTPRSTCLVSCRAGSRRARSDCSSVRAARCEALFAPANPA